MAWFSVEVLSSRSSIVTTCDILRPLCPVSGSDDLILTWNSRLLRLTFPFVVVVLLSTHELLCALDSGDDD